ncbi:hypothetical protein [Bacillus sp. FJAT-27986]|uniref:hypothetical protein n=1 Tax=Bacillus sp. FJAT-27986 TaxID=1743146 RepID=UPI00080AFB80|nr:hypothetical protein [Bacillus sp. FJAT-27986]OCA86809.1 hypothetical protein A8L44_05890 [Bacillus sp. FJAT-27986]
MKVGCWVIQGIELSCPGVFANKHNHRWEDVIIRVKIPLLKEARNLQQSFGKLVVDCYSEDNAYELDDIIIRPKQISNPEDLEIQSHMATFSNIRKEIIQSIRMAKHSINWTPTANQNKEHLTVSVDRQLAEQYTENFKEIFRTSNT